MRFCLVVVALVTLSVAITSCGDGEAPRATPLSLSLPTPDVARLLEATRVARVTAVAQNTPTPIPAPSPVPTIAYVTAVPAATTGRVSGSLSYPSEGIPPEVMACAENQATKVIYCTRERIYDARFVSRVGYELVLPAGPYLVFAPGPGNHDFRAYYSQMVVCGFDPRRCFDHAPIVVDVRAGVTLNGIDPGDWYAR